MGFGLAYSGTRAGESYRFPLLIPRARYDVSNAFSARSSLQAHHALDFAT